MFERKDLLFLFLHISSFAQLITQSKLSNPILFEHKDVTGKVFQHNFDSKILNNSRVIFVLLPKGYNQNKHKYPLLIVHDGRAVFYSKNRGFGKKNKPERYITQTWMEPGRNG